MVACRLSFVVCVLVVFLFLYIARRFFVAHSLLIVCCPMVGCVLFVGLLCAPCCLSIDGVLFVNSSFVCCWLLVRCVLFVVCCVLLVVSR